jgi:predicted polyphosphate/ATP-dependent NAD kinase
MRAGLIVNPTAGMGGSVALKGTDGVADEALRRGAAPRAPGRAVRALAALRAACPDATVVTCAGAMGEDEVRAAGTEPELVLPVRTPSTAGDTRRAATRMLDLAVDLLLFAGGDGTAADLHAAVGGQVPVLGVPAGVKMHSGVFAATPEAAGALAGAFLGRRVTRVTAREVLDLDEDLLRAGVLAPRLIGDLDVPATGGLVQHPKRRGGSERGALEALGAAVVAELPAGALVAVGPGRTAGAVLAALGLPHTLLGFDLVRDGALVAADVPEGVLLAHADELHVVLAPTGGQGALLGRGNQQLTPAVLRRIVRERIHVVATRERLAELQGRPLLVDLDDPDLARSLEGIWPVGVGRGRVVRYPVAAPSVALAGLHTSPSPEEEQP